MMIIFGQISLKKRFLIPVNLPVLGSTIITCFLNNAPKYLTCKKSIH